MTIWLLLLLPLSGGVLAWASGKVRPDLSRWISTVVLAAGLSVSLQTWLAARQHQPPTSPWLGEVDWAWIPRFGIRFHLGLDGLSLLMIVLTYLLGLAAVIASWREVRHRVPFFHLNVLLTLGGVIGVFLALDLFLFYFFWELMLLPMVLLILIWGHERRLYAAVKFFLFTQTGGLLLLLGILGLVFAHREQTGILSFDYFDLTLTSFTPATGTLLLLAFLAAFLIKLPMVPLHTWLPDAHTQAPTAGSVILAGLLLKTGAYGLIRFALPLFPEAAARIAPLAMGLGAVGILYGAVLALVQTDLKRLVAYTSVSHLGFVLLGVFAWNGPGLSGAVLQMLCHGLSTGGLFIIVGMLDERLHTRSLDELSGLWSAMPVMGTVTLLFALGSLGLPGLGNFVAEFLALLGAFAVQSVTTSVATIGLVLATVYALWMLDKAFRGPLRVTAPLSDLSRREFGVTLALALGLVGLGIAPQPVLDAVRPALDHMQRLGTPRMPALARRP